MCISKSGIFQWSLSQTVNLQSPSRTTTCGRNAGAEVAVAWLFELKDVLMKTLNGFHIFNNF